MAFLSPCRVELWYHKKMARISNDSLCVVSLARSCRCQRQQQIENNGLVASRVVLWLKTDHSRVMLQFQRFAFYFIRCVSDETVNKHTVFAVGQLAALKCGQAFEDVLHLNEVCLPCWPQQGNHHSSFCSPAVSYQLWQPALSSLHLPVARC